jgi:hypothetical protein
MRKLAGNVSAWFVLASLADSKYSSTLLSKTASAVFITIRGGMMIILLAGGDKSTQQSDIQRAIKLAKEV